MSIGVFDDLEFDSNITIFALNGPLSVSVLPYERLGALQSLLCWFLNLSDFATMRYRPNASPRPFWPDNCYEAKFPLVVAQSLHAAPPPYPPIAESGLSVAG